MSFLAGFTYSKQEETLLTREKMAAGLVPPWGKCELVSPDDAPFTILRKREGSTLLKEGNILLLLEGFLTGETKEKDLLSLYRRSGWEQLLSHLEGSFLLLLWDEEKRTFFLAKDPLGTKSLYYFSRGKEFAFAGNLSALKSHPSFPEEWDLQSIWDYLTFGYIPGEATHFKGVKKLLPGTFLQITLPRNETDAPLLCRKRYWKADLSKKTDLPYEELLSHCREKLSSSTRILLEKAQNLTGKSPVLFLSGGLDSAIVSALSLENTSSPLKGYSISFEDPLYDEGALAGESATFLNERYKGRFIHKILRVKGEELLPRLEKMISFGGLPYGDSSLLPTSYLCAKAAEEGESFALNGDGADELYGGYERYIAMELYGKLQFFPAFLLKNAALALSLFSRKDGSDRGKLARMIRFLKGASLPSQKEQYFMLISHGKEELKKSIATSLFEEVAASFNDFDRESLLTSQALCRGEGPMALDLAHYLAFDTLPKAEFAADSAGLISTTPFLAGESLSFALSLPFSCKIKGFHRKKLLCDAFKDQIVPGLSQRKKRGFGVPVGSFFRSSWKECIRTHLEEGELTGSGLFRKEALLKIFQEHEKGKDHSYILFYLLALSLALGKK